MFGNFSLEFLSPSLEIILLRYPQTVKTNQSPNPKYGKLPFLYHSQSTFVILNQTDALSVVSCVLLLSTLFLYMHKVLTQKAFGLK